MLVEAEIWTIARTDKGNAVLIKPFGAERAVPIFIRQLEAQSILIGLGSLPMPRPLTHDLFITLAQRLSISFERVEITDLKEGIFYSHILMKHGMKKLALGARPSDALSIVARVHCPLFIAESIVEKAGISVNLITDEEEPTAVNQEQQQKEAEASERGRLQEKLEQAIEEENYEEAAQLRDRIQNMS